MNRPLCSQGRGLSQGSGKVCGGQGHGMLPQHNLAELGEPEPGRESLEHLRSKAGQG